jgi:hypothetical protein
MPAPAVRNKKNRPIISDGPILEIMSDDKQFEFRY